MACGPTSFLIDPKSSPGPTPFAPREGRPPENFAVLSMDLTRSRAPNHLCRNDLDRRRSGAVLGPGAVAPARLTASHAWPRCNRTTQPANSAEREECGAEQAALRVITAIDRGNRIPARVQDLTIPNHEEGRFAAAIHLALSNLPQQLPLQVHQLLISRRADGLSHQVLDFVSLEPEQRLTH